MRNRILLIIIIIQLVLLLTVNKKVNLNYKYCINPYKQEEINKNKLENYVIGVVAAEMPATFSLESLKAQAVAARTFAYKKVINNKLNYDNLSSDKGQSYISKEQMKEKWQSDFQDNYNKISEAVLSTKGEVIKYNGEVINAYYFSISNGKTENSSSVFGEASYLVSVDSSWDKENSKEYNKTVIIPINDFKNKLNIKDNIIIDNISRSNTDHVDSIKINNETYKGVEIRKILGLRSTDFDIYINDDNVYINTKGYGHGVGMSQYGANYMAKEGKKYDEIIKYFYQGVSIEKI